MLPINLEIGINENAIIMARYIEPDTKRGSWSGFNVSHDKARSGVWFSQYDFICFVVFIELLIELATLDDLNFQFRRVWMLDHGESAIDWVSIDKVKEHGFIQQGEIR
jgi:hypothetical protein